MGDPLYQQDQSGRALWFSATKVPRLDGSWPANADLAEDGSVCGETYIYGEGPSSAILTGFEHQHACRDFPPQRPVLHGPHGSALLEGKFRQLDFRNGKLMEQSRCCAIDRYRDSVACIGTGNSLEEGIQHAALMYWQEGVEEIPIPSSFVRAYGSDVCWIKERPHAIGTFEDSYIRARGFLSIAGKTTLVPLPRGAQGNRAIGINHKGQVTGRIDLGDYQFRAYLWQSGLLGLLPWRMTILEQFDDWPNGQGQAINDLGEVVGHVSGADLSPRQAALWDTAGQLHLLGSMGCPTTEANDINNRREVVGTAIIRKGVDFAWLWVDGVMRDLNDLVPAHYGVKLLRGLAINNRGQILAAGTSKVKGDKHRLYLLNRLG